MNDSEYVKFIKEHENKPFSEYESQEPANKIIKALASINSNKRKGDRSYNEMYGSNPKRVMGVFAYNTDYNENYGNPIAFLNRKNSENYSVAASGTSQDPVYERTKFLRRYALEHDIPFVVFGD